jgi:hypothetical protein
MPFPNEGGHGHDVGWHIWPVCILQLKIFGRQFIIFGLQKHFVKFQMAHSMQQKLLKLMKNEQDMPSPSERGHWHDVGWHIWLVCILELKIFGCHSFVFAFQKGFLKLQMVYPMQKKLF